MRTLTFEVSEVQRATEPMDEVPYKHALSYLLGEPVFDSKQQLALKVSDVSSRLDYLNRTSEQLAESKQRLARALANENKMTDEAAKQSLRKRTIFFQDQIQKYSQDLVNRHRHPDIYISELKQQLVDLQQQLVLLEAIDPETTCLIEACSRDSGRLVANVAKHPVIEALHLSFAGHRPLCLSPDMVWLLICQGVAQHLNLHAERLRSKIVQHAGKQPIEVRRDDFIKASLENPWGEVVDELCMRVKEHIGSVHDLFKPHFSTTGPTERIAAEIVLLDAVQNYFEYRLHTLCGIPTITLEGTIADWQALADRAEMFAQFDLDWWLTGLRPILHELIETAKGSVQRTFWKSIFKYESASGGDVITGWIVAFFPYLMDEQGHPTIKNPWLAEGSKVLQMLPDAVNRDQLLDGPRLEGFPSGLSRTPFTWFYLWQKFKMELLAGFVGVAQDATTLTLRPEIGWAVRQKLELPTI